MAARPLFCHRSWALRVLCGSAAGRFLFCPVCAFAQRVSALAAGSLFFGALCRSRSTLRPATVRQRRGQFLAGFDGNPLSPRPCLGNSARWRGAGQGIPRACIDEAACAPVADRGFPTKPARKSVSNAAEELGEPVPNHGGRSAARPPFPCCLIPAPSRPHGSDAGRAAFPAAGLTARCGSALPRERDAQGEGMGCCGFAHSPVGSARTPCSRAPAPMLLRIPSAIFRDFPHKGAFPNAQNRIYCFLSFKSGTERPTRHHPERPPEQGRERVEAFVCRGGFFSCPRAGAANSGAARPDGEEPDGARLGGSQVRLYALDEKKGCV